MLAAGAFKSNRAVLTKVKKGEKKIRSFKKGKKSNYKSYSATATWPRVKSIKKKFFYQHTTSFPPNFQSSWWAVGFERNAFDKKGLPASVRLLKATIAI